MGQESREGTVCRSRI